NAATIINSSMAKNKQQYFVPQLYLSQFGIHETELISIMQISPCRFIGAGTIKDQCKDDYFFGQDSKLDAMLQDMESHIGPTLVVNITNTKKCFKNKL
ncbi:hypothetical protein, partial [Termitidicoccus mucosus]